jgi:hypothetical protein
LALKDISFNLLDDMSHLLSGLSSYSEPPEVAVYDKVAQGYDEVSEVSPGYDEVSEVLPGYDHASDIAQGHDEVDTRRNYENLLAARHEPLRDELRKHGDEVLDNSLSNKSSPDIEELLSSTNQNAQEYYYTLGGLSPQISPPLSTASHNTAEHKVYDGTEV